MTMNLLRKIFDNAIDFSLPRKDPNYFYIFKMKAMIFSIIYFYMLVGCASLKTKHTHVKMHDNQFNSVDNVTAMPIFSKKTRLSVGAEGRGPESRLIVQIGKTFILNSGESIYSNDIITKAAMVAPMIVIAEDIKVYKWILLKEGFFPIIVDRKFMNKRYVLYVDGKEIPPIVFSSGGKEERIKIINALVSDPPDYEYVRKITNMNSIDKIHITNQGRSFIEMQK